VASSRSNASASCASSSQRFAFSGTQGARRRRPTIARGTTRATRLLPAFVARSRRDASASAAEWGSGSAARRLDAQSRVRSETTAVVVRRSSATERRLERSGSVGSGGVVVVVVVVVLAPLVGVASNRRRARVSARTKRVANDGDVEAGVPALFSTSSSSSSSSSLGSSATRSRVVVSSHFSSASARCDSREGGRVGSRHGGSGGRRGAGGESDDAQL
jgi:hypothetical protein